MDFDRYPRIPRRRSGGHRVRNVIATWLVAIALCVLIGWLAAQAVWP